MAKIYLKCERCEAELKLKERDFEVRTEEDNLIIRKQCAFCGFKNEEVVYLGK